MVAEFRDLVEAEAAEVVALAAGRGHERVVTEVVDAGDRLVGVETGVALGVAALRNLDDVAEGLEHPTDGVAVDLGDLVGVAQLVERGTPLGEVGQAAGDEERQQGVLPADHEQEHEGEHDAGHLDDLPGDCQEDQEVANILGTLRQGHGSFLPRTRNVSGRCHPLLLEMSSSNSHNEVVVARPRASD